MGDVWLLNCSDCTLFPTGIKYLYIVSIQSGRVIVLPLKKLSSLKKRRSECDFVSLSYDLSEVCDPEIFLEIVRYSVTEISVDALSDRIGSISLKQQRKILFNINNRKI